MKALVLSITAGGGHNATAKAVQDSLQAQGVECRFLDTFEHLSPFLYSATEGIFSFSADHASKPYALGYRACEKLRNSPKLKPLRELASFLADKLSVYLENYQPDVVIATHVFPSMLLSSLKKRGLAGFTAIGVLTDFTYHPFWEECTHLDYLVTPNDMFGWEGAQRGFAPGQLLPFGIPIHPKFQGPSRYTKEQIRQALGLETDCPTVLVMSGSMGHGSMSRTVQTLDALPNRMQMIVVCGSNKEEKHRLHRLRFHKKVVVLGWVNYVDKLMDASDCLITKPGGITTSEAMAKNLPIVMINPLPGQEDRNVEFLLNNGVAMFATKTNPLDNVLFQLLNNPQRQQSMQTAIEALRRPASTQTLVDFILQNA